MSSALLLAATSAMQPAGAQERLVALRFGSTASWDSNVFRVPDTVSDPQAARGISGTSDRITTSYVGINLNKAYSQQRLLFDLTKSATRYQKFSYLDRDTYSYRGEWQWHLTPHISGSLNADRAENPVPFDDTGDLEQNVVVTTNRNFTVVGRLSGGWQLSGGLTESKRRNSRPFASDPDSDRTGAEAGIRYVATSRSFLGFVRRHQRGELTAGSAGQVAFGTGKFTVEESELAALWTVTGKSTLTARLTHTQRRREGAPERDFSGRGGELTHSWSPTGRLTIATSLTRAVAPFELTAQSSYRVDETLAVSPGLQITEKIRATLRLSRQTTQFLGAVTPLASDPRRDALKSASIALEWAAHRAAVLGASLRRDERTSNDAAFDFDSTVVGLTAAFTL